MGGEEALDRVGLSVTERAKLFKECNHAAWIAAQRHNVLGA